MTDEEPIREFEAATLPVEAFTHEAHVRVAWWYLRHYASLPDALASFAAALKRCAAAKGSANKYHETITVAWMLLIADRLGDDPSSAWPEFAERHPDLFRKSPSPLAAYYRPEVLGSDRARRAFVMPASSFHQGASPSIADREAEIDTSRLRAPANGRRELREPTSWPSCSPELLQSVGWLSREPSG